MVASFVVLMLSHATTVEQRPSAAGLLELKVTAETDIAPERLADSFWRGGRKSIDAVKKRVMLAQSPNEQIIYFQLALPVVKDRDYTVRIERYADSKNALYQFTTRCDASAGPAETKDHVRVSDCRGQLTIERLENGRTLVTYVAFANPAGNVPPFIVNMLAPKAATDVVEGLIAGTQEHIALNR